MNLNLKEVINASGRMTKLGVSTQSDYVKNASNYAQDRYFIMDDLYLESGKYISKILNVKSAAIVNSASAGIVLTLASLITGNNITKIRNFSTLEIPRNKVLIPSGHIIDYGAPVKEMVSLARCELVPCGSVNKVEKEDIENRIDQNTLCILYIKSHHCVQKNMLSIEECVNISKKHNIPLVVDCAAEEDFQIYHNLGVNYAIYSGSKALCSCASGLIITDDLEKSKAIINQHNGIGRCMKIGKENIFSLIAAIEQYQSDKKTNIVSLEYLNDFISKVNEIPGISASITKDEAGREIYRASLKFDPSIFGANASEVNKILKDGNPSIYCRDHQKNLNILNFDPRPLKSKEELDIIFQAINSIHERSKK